MTDFPLLHAVDNWKLWVNPDPRNKEGYVQFLNRRLDLSNLVECGPLEKGMASHFNILALRTP